MIHNACTSFIPFGGYVIAITALSIQYKDHAVSPNPCPQQRFPSHTTCVRNAQVIVKCPSGPGGRNLGWKRYQSVFVNTKVSSPSLYLEPMKRISTRSYNSFATPETRTWSINGIYHYIISGEHTWGFHLSWFRGLPDDRNTALCHALSFAVNTQNRSLYLVTHMLNT